MKPTTKAALKQITVILVAGVAAFIVWEIVKAIRAGERTIAGILMAPFNALGAVKTAIAGLFDFGGPAAPAITDADTAGINNPATGLPITADNATATLLLPAPGASETVGWDNWLASLSAP